MTQDRQAMTIRLSRDRHDWLREQAFRRRVPMQQILDEAIDALRLAAPRAANDGDVTR